MKIAIIGSGIAGNVAAYHLNKEHDITLFEKNNYVGGHTNTHEIVESNSKTLNIDTGFIVLNDRTYPHFTSLLNELGVNIQKSEMSFSVKCEHSGLEYNGDSLNTLFAQRRNLLNPRFYKMIIDILRFNKEAAKDINTGNDDTSLGEYLVKNKYSDIFINKYIVPMGAAIWSTTPEDMFRFPAKFFFSFFQNHGLLTVNNRPQWYVINNGSKSYVEKLIENFKDKIRTNCSVKNIKRFDDHIELTTEDYGVERFDYVFIASHTDEALNMLDKASTDELSTLAAIPYQKNEAVLHTDASLLPKRNKAWASWNYHIPLNPQDEVALTYNMNILQNLQTDKTYCVTLNYSENINPQKIIKKISYDHPIFTPEGISAQKNHRLINGTSRTYYCGAYWRNGFHEDGVVSALTALEHFKQDYQNEQLHLRRAS